MGTGKEDWEDFKRTIVTINGELTLTELVQIPLKKNIWENYSLRVFAYNKNNQLVQVLDRYWQSGMETWDDNYLMLYEYNSENQIKRLTHTNIYNSKPFLCSREFYTYNDAGQISEKIIQRYENNEWVNFMKTSFIRPATDILIAEENYYWKDGSWGNKHSATKYNYGNDGELSSKEIEVNIAGIPLVKSRQEMKYNTDGMLGSVTGYILNEKNLGWEPQHKMTFSYQPDAKIYSRDCQIWSEGEWEHYILCSSSSDIPNLFEKQIADDMSVCILPGNTNKSLTIAFDNFSHENFKVRLLNCYGGEITSITTDGCEVTLNTRELDEAEYYIEIQGSSLYSGKLSLD